MSRSKLINVALGKRPADLVVQNAQIVNVHTCEVYDGGVAVAGERIAYVGDLADETIGQETRVVDAGGRFLVPGFIDAHIHVESTLLTPSEFAKAVLPRGTAVVATDLMEVTLVAGVPGLMEILEECRALPIAFYYMVPSFMEELELQTVGGLLSPELVDELIDLPEAMGLAEVLVPPVLNENPDVAHMIDTATKKRKTREGHAPDLYGREMQAYVAAGITSDHESTNAEEALGKIRAGERLYIREGSASTDLKPVVKIITEHGVDPRHVAMISDDIDALHITQLGHMDHKIRLAINEGVDPLVAIQMATLNPAQGMRIDEDWGSIAPGKYASMALLDGNLSDCHVSTMIAQGEVAYSDGAMATNLTPATYSNTLTDTVHLAGTVAADDLVLTVDDDVREARVRVLGASGITLLKSADEAVVPVENGVLLPDVENDVLRMACLDRHKGSGRVGKAFVSGFGLEAGALASSVGHDHHNITVVGRDADDMAVAVNRIAELGGGLVVVRDGEVAGELPLPVCGLVTTESAEEVARRVEQMNRVLRDLGCEMESPFMTLSFITLIYIPSYAITDRGLVEFSGFELVEPILDVAQ